MTTHDAREFDEAVGVDRPPTPRFRLPSAAYLPWVRDYEEFKRGFQFVGTIAFELGDAARELAALAEEAQGRYHDGMEISLQCRAASCGAIVAACAAFEARMNDQLFQLAHRRHARSHFSDAREGYPYVLRYLSPRHRLTALFATSGGVSAFKSVKLVGRLPSRKSTFDMLTRSCAPRLPGRFCSTTVRAGAIGPVGHRLVRYWPSPVITTSLFQGKRERLEVAERIL